MTKLDRGVSVKSLYGGRFLPPEVVRHSLAALETRLTSEFKERVKVRAEMAELMRMYRSPLIETISKDKRASEAVSGLRRLYAGTHERKRRPPPQARGKERIFTGSIGATQTPPYDYQWTWNAVAGNALANIETADEVSGAMSLSIWTDQNNSSSISGRTAVGIYFYPPVENGSLQIWSSPAFTDDWGTFCNLDGASADAWIGLYVASSDLTGASTGAVVDQQVQLWSDSSWWSGTGAQQGSNSGFGLYAPPIQVDQDHQYAIWVWAGGDVSAAGFGGAFWGSGAGDDLNIVVPSITWELG
jgi:hypothetical protein